MGLLAITLSVFAVGISAISVMIACMVRHEIRDMLDHTKKVLDLNDEVIGINRVLLKEDGNGHSG